MLIRRLAVTTFAMACSAAALAGTTQEAPSVYRVDAGVAFAISNAGASNYLFSWTDETGTFTNIADPTLILIEGETYTFQRTTGSHPLVITNDQLPVSGSDGAYNRTTSDGALIDSLTLTPIADFTADPGPTSDLISWAVALGDYYYTCRVTGHIGMTGAIRVEAATQSSPQDLNGDGLVDGADLGILLGAWGMCPDGQPCPADFNADGFVDGADLGVLLGAWGTTR
ncbi:MAG: hypothetical protein ACF8QF_03690 [Phycisphaerales bacterium]